MKKLLGRLIVEIDDESLESASTRRIGPDLFLITMRPKNGLKAEMEHQAEVLAHELGHFTANILGLPEHTKQAQAGLMPVPLVPVESEAWRVAHMINPEMGQTEAEHESIESYKEHDKELGSAMRLFKLMRFLGLV